jgi:hypothetical protein
VDPKHWQSFAQCGICRLSEDAHRLLVRSLCNVLLLSWPGIQEQKWEDRKKHLGWLFNFDKTVCKSCVVQRCICIMDALQIS